MWDAMWEYVFVSVRACISSLILEAFDELLTVLS